MAYYCLQQSFTKAMKTKKSSNTWATILKRNTWMNKIDKSFLLRSNVLAIFLLLGVVTFLFFTRSTQTVQVRLFLTEREWAKTWDNYPDYFYAEKIAPGMVEKDELGRVSAKILDITSNNLPYTHNVAIATIELKANYNQRSQTYSFQGQPLLIGDYQRLKIGGVRVQGYLLDVAEELPELEQKSKILTVAIEDLEESDRTLQDSRANGISSETAESLSVGQKIIDQNGQPILEIKEIDIKPAVRTFYSAAGQYQQVDYSLREGKLQVEVTVLSINGIDYWNFTEPLQVGKRTTFNFDSAIVPVRILEVKDAQ